MTIYKNVLDLIGQTPILEVSRLDTGQCRLFLKLESQNPGGSVKDRIALAMIEAAEKAGDLRPGMTIVEATAGNTGIALAMVAAQKGYDMLIVMPDKMSKEKVQHLIALGAEVIMTRSDVSKGHPEYYLDMAERIAQEREDAYYIGQFENPANPQAHEENTAPEIWEQMDGQVDAIVCGVGTSGTITGIGRFMQEKAPHVEMIIADPKGSILADYINYGELKQKDSVWLVEGIGEDYLPTIADLSVTKKAYTVNDQEAFAMVRELAKKEGILAGSSSGVLLHAALQYCREQTTPKNVLTFVCDTGDKYLSKAYNDEWLREKGLIPDEPQSKEQNTQAMGLATQVIHGGQQFDPSTGAVMVPIYATSTYAQERPGVHQGFEYSRSHNPTRFAYERCVATLENGKAGFAFASGMAAIATTLELLNAGDHVVAMDDLYGGTYRLFANVRKRSANLDFSFVDLSDLKNLKDAIKPNTRMLWLETPTNPLLKLVDIAAICDAVKDKDIIVVVDNTFASPYNQNPLNLGADIVVHSATKYLNGHSDVVNGVVVVGDNAELEEQLRYLQNAIGAVAGPFDSFLALRGIKTLALRMAQHAKSAMHLAEWLSAHPKVEKVYYPGQESHPQYALAKQQMRTPGGIISFVLKDGLSAAKQCLERTHLFTLAESLGGVESLIEHPAIMTHASIPKEQRDALGISDGFIRLSVGIEDVQDLQTDLTDALG